MTLGALTNKLIPLIQPAPAMSRQKKMRCAPSSEAINVWMKKIVAIHYRRMCVCVAGVTGSASW